MTMNILLRKLYLENKKFATSSELKEYCRRMKLDYDITVRNLEFRGYLVRIFRGIFYVKSLEEAKLGKSEYDRLELVAKGLQLKNVSNWYFGLHTALKLNNMTHEHFAMEDVVSDSLFRAKPVAIAGYKFKFIRLSSSLLDFGIKTMKNGVRYSDSEKTVLDFIYIWRYNGIPESKIIADVSEWARDISKKKLMRYAKKYPKSVKNIAKKVVE